MSEFEKKQIEKEITITLIQSPKGSTGSKSIDKKIDNLIKAYNEFVLEIFKITKTCNVERLSAITINWIEMGDKLSEGFNDNLACLLDIFKEYFPDDYGKLNIEQLYGKKEIEQLIYAR